MAAILAIAGIVMMTYADGFHSHSVIGITLVVASASTSALYKVREVLWGTASMASYRAVQSRASEGREYAGFHSNQSPHQLISSIGSLLSG